MCQSGQCFLSLLGALQGLFLTTASIPLLHIKMYLQCIPCRSRFGSRPASRPHSPTSKPTSLQPLAVVKGATTDPLRVLPINISLRIFSLLTVKELARCSRVSKKWNKSQTLNHGESLRIFSTRRRPLFSVRVQSGSNTSRRRVSATKVCPRASGPSATPR